MNLRRFAQNKKAIFIKIDPEIVLGEGFLEAIISLSLRRGTVYLKVYKTAAGYFLRTRYSLKIRFGWMFLALKKNY